MSKKKAVGSHSEPVTRAESQSKSDKPTLTDSTTGPREVIEQAERDVGQGLVDTDWHGAPSNVPGPRRSQRAELPAAGGNRATYSERRRSPRPDDDRSGKNNESGVVT